MEGSVLCDENSNLEDPLLSSKDKRGQAENAQDSFPLQLNQPLQVQSHLHEDAPENMGIVEVEEHEDALIPEKNVQGTLTEDPDVEEDSSHQNPEIAISEDQILVEPSGEKSRENIPSWYKSLSLDAELEEELKKSIQKKINFYCRSHNDSVQKNHYGFLLKSQPTKFLTMHLLKNFFSVDNVEHSINDLLKIKSLFMLYASHLSQYYDNSGFMYLIQSTLAHLCKKDFIHVNPDLKWAELSPQAKSVVYGAKLYFSLLFQDFRPALNLVRKLRAGHTVPEWQVLCCQVQRLKRLRQNIPIVKPKKVEMDFLRRGIALDPANIPCRILACEVLFDWMRTDDRKPGVQIYGEVLGDVDDVAQFLHEEFLDLLAKKLPQVFSLELYVLASSFYGYKNLPRLLTKKPDWRTTRVDFGKLEERGEDVLDYYSLLSRAEAMDLSEYYLKMAVTIQSRNADASICMAFRALRKFCREDALKYLKLALEDNGFNENLIVFYVRVLIGGTAEEQNEAFLTIEKYTNLRMRWSSLFLVHLYFLKGSLFWLRKEVKECIQAWIQGLYIDPVQFLNQFSFWSKTQIRKHLWPEAFSNFEMIDTLKKALSLLANLAEDTFEDPRIPSASAAFLTEMDFYFPSTWKMTEEIAMLSKEWFYLLDSHETQRKKFESSSSESDEEDDEGDDIIEIPVETGTNGNQKRFRGKEPSIEYMDLDNGSLLLQNPTVSTPRIQVHIPGTFYVQQACIPQLNPEEVITLD